MKRVVVIGGGVAGCAAAVAAAEAGAAVTLLEASAHLGGVAARGEHRSLCGLAAIDADTPALLEAPATKPWVDAVATGEPWRQGRVWLWPTTADYLQQACAQRLASAGVDLRLRSSLTRVQGDDTRLTALGTEGEWFACDAWIDASGGSAVAAVLDAPLRDAQAWGAWRGIIRADIGEGLAARSRALTVVAKVSGSPAAAALLPIGEQRWQLSLDVPATVTSATAAQTAARVAEALGGCLESGASTIAARDSGGWAAHCSIETLFSTSERACCWAAWPVEAHGPDGVIWRWPAGSQHGIPEACVKPSRAAQNGLVVGRGMPVDGAAIAALRVTGTLLALGHAVGQRAAAV